MGAWQPWTAAEVGRIVKLLSATDIYEALKAELDHPQGYLSPDPLTLDSVTIDGTISCEDIAKFLNERLK